MVGTHPPNRPAPLPTQPGTQIRAFPGFEIHQHIPGVSAQLLLPSSTGTEQLGLPLDPWKCPRPGWMELGAWDSGRCPCLWQEVE